MLMGDCLYTSLFICSVECYMCDCLFFNETATPEIYTYRPTLSLHDALPICRGEGGEGRRQRAVDDRPLAAFPRRDDGRGRAHPDQRALRGARQIGRAHV